MPFLTTPPPPRPFLPVHLAPLKFPFCSRFYPGLIAMRLLRAPSTPPSGWQPSQHPSSLANAENQQKDVLHPSIAVKEETLCPLPLVVLTMGAAAAVAVAAAMIALTSKAS